MESVAKVFHGDVKIGNCRVPRSQGDERFPTCTGGSACSSAPIMAFGGSVGLGRGYSGERTNGWLRTRMPDEHNFAAVIIAWKVRANAWCLVALLVLAVAPRSLFHHCGEHAEHVGAAGSTVHEDCATCDAAMVHALPAAPVQVSAALQVFFEHRSLGTDDLYCAAFERTADRGPPSVG